MGFLKSNRLTNLLIKWGLIAPILLTNYKFSYSQNILYNSNFSYQLKCCEVDVKHPVGWFYVGFYSKIRKIKSNFFLATTCYNNKNKYFSFNVGSLIEPLKLSESYTLKINLKDKKTFFLLFSTVKKFPIKTDQDTSVFESTSFKKVLIVNSKKIQINITPIEDSSYYLILRFADTSSLKVKSIELLIDKVEVIKNNNESIFCTNLLSRIEAIIHERRVHDFTTPCIGSKTYRWLH